MKNDPNQPWKNAVLNLIESRDRGDLFCADTIRIEASNLNLPAPPSPAMWGSVVHAAANKHRLIRATGRCAKSVLASAHKRNQIVWRRTANSLTA